MKNLDKEVQKKDDLQYLWLQLWNLSLEQVITNEKLKAQMDEGIKWGLQLQNKEITQIEYESLLKGQAEIIKMERK